MTQNPSAPTPTGVSGLLRSFAHRLGDDDAVLPDEGHLASFDGATGWLNSEPLTPDGLRGRVVLVDFWTYTCVNWLRTLPYLRAWADKYGEQGLTIVGVHTPEFGFERDVDNITSQARALRVHYPIAIDSQYGVWGAFANHFWPAVYLADAEGRIRFHHFGEGEYAMTEMVIQQLLMDAGAHDVDQDLVMVEPEGLEVAADWRTLQSPETYVGYGQSSGFASEPDAAFDQPHSYSLPPLRLNQWALAGTWTVARHAGVLERAERTDRVPFPRARREPGHGTGLTWKRRSRSGCSSTASRPVRRVRGRRGRERRRDGRRAADLPAHPPVGPDLRAAVRDRVPRRRRRGVLLHVRLMATPRAWFPLAPVFGSTRLFRARRCSTFGPSSR